MEVFAQDSSDHNEKALVGGYSSNQSEEVSREHSSALNEEAILKEEHLTGDRDFKERIRKYSPVYDVGALERHSTAQSEEKSRGNLPTCNELTLEEENSPDDSNGKDAIKEPLPEHNDEEPRGSPSINTCHIEVSNIQPHSQFTEDEDSLGEEDHVHNNLIPHGVQIEYKHYQCHVCSKTFTKNGHLKVHLLTHTSERPYKCDLCGKSFTQSGNLKRHLSTHINERPRQCSFCNQTFAQIGQLKLHLLIHTNGRPYQCTLCEKSFTQKGDLNRHVLIHSKERPHKCNLCNQKFKQSAHLKGHLLTHTGERPHQCQECGKSYKESGHLKRHLQTHFNDRPHQCTICLKSYIRSEHLKRHLLTHSNEIPPSVS